MFDDLALFVAVVDHGGFAPAATALSMPPATLSRRIKALEAALGVRLMHRSARGLTLTQAGTQYVDRCRPLLRELTQATGGLDEELHGLRGRVMVLAPINLAKNWVAPAFLRYMRSYPDIRLDLRLSNRVQDLMHLPFDLAIRTGQQPDSSLVGRLIGTIPTVPVASPAYLAAAGQPRTPHDLMAHKMLVGLPFSRWEFRKGDDEVAFDAAGALTVDELDFALMAALDGQGITVAPVPVVAPDLAAGRLVRLLPDWTLSRRDIWLVWPNRDFVPERVRVLIDQLADFATERMVEDDRLLRETG